MNRDIGAFLGPVLAIVVFAVIASQTANALRASGAWSGLWHRKSEVVAPAPDDPFAPLAALLARDAPALDPETLRDPFTLGSAPVAVVSGKPITRKPAVPAPPARPVLTAIVFDADPRALVHWQGRDFTVRSGGLFDVFQVVGITRDQVTLSRGSETIVLQRKPQGD